eukprot:TRINITY_DN6072_c0_g1_i1.p1 TRINITY_DN6072_c0_g1~~TRINITY_DN6072_c0_g1_i1.p1  ORF type:complete len:611 (-),score=103.93 TRINITY_DN6072_c0_g1_i1:52-1848(-)
MASSKSRLRNWGLRCLALRCPLRRSSGSKAEPQDSKSPVGTESSSVAAANSRSALADQDEERLCRYCFEGPEVDELISPCRCAGGQKYVHLKCLRRWQRAVLVSQPTHPDFYDSDTRQRICNVCNTQFSCAPPTRAELLASFTGPELAALIEERCFIGSAESFSQELERQLSPFPASVREGIASLNWVRGLFLIVKVVQDRSRESVMLQIDDGEELDFFLRHLEPDSRTFHLRGRRFSVLPQGPLKDLSQSESPEIRREFIRSVRTPATIRLRPDRADDCGEDGIVAVNLARPFDPATSDRIVLRAQQRAAFHAAKRRVLEERGQAELLAQVTHFTGGPCEEEKVAACIIVSGSSFSVVRNSEDEHGQDSGDDTCVEAALSSAEELAASAATADASHEGSSAAAAGAAAAAALGLAGAGQPERTEAPKRRRLASDMAEAQAAAGPVRVFVYWGYAGWSRCQLMGEIARGSWGLCKADPEDVISCAPSQVWGAVYPRLVFAPHSEMSESYGSGAPDEEERRTQLRRMAIIHDLLTGNGDDSASDDVAEHEGEGGEDGGEEEEEDEENSSRGPATVSPTDDSGISEEETLACGQVRSPEC